MYDEHVPVLIAGGGYAGLSAATLLAWRGVPVLLVERHASTSIQPKAFGVNQRAMELLRVVPGLEQALMGVSAGIADDMRIAIGSSLSDPNPRMIVHSNDDMSFVADITPAPAAGVPQSQVERILRAKAEELGADLRFSTELVTFDQDADGVTAVLRDHATRSERTVRADYLIGADGHRSPVRTRLGVPTRGRGTLSHTYAIMFDADLSGLVRERETIVWYVQNDVLEGAIVSGTGVGSHVLGVTYHPERGEGPADFTEDRCRDLVRAAVGRPDLDVKIIDHTTFTIAHVVAERFAAGRVFLAGDAAHTMPPTGGQGGSTALQDGCDIAWRLALVISGQAGPGLLATYDAERRPIGELTADSQLANFGVRMAPELLRELPEPVADPWSVILGYRYHSTAVVTEPDDDGSLLEDPRQPTGRPGSRAPHVPLERAGERLSTIDLFGRGFVLLAGPSGTPWATAAGEVADRLGVELTAHRIGDRLVDVEGVWTQRYGVTDAGAVLVRPDGYVAWRSAGAVADPRDSLTRVLTHVLAR